jgi:Domain of unknown function (DUF5979)
MSKRNAFFSRWSAMALPLASTLFLLSTVHTASAQMISGTLAVKKVVVNQVGPSATIPSTFNITTHCSQNAAYPGANTPVAVPPGQTVVQSTTMPPGIICSVTEAVPPPIAGLADCKGRNAVWTVSYSAPVTIASGQTSTLTVTNTLACAAPTGGSLTVFKEVVNTLGVPNPANFAVLVSCTGRPVVPLQIAPNQSIPISNNIPGGTVCTVTETLPPPVSGVRACPSGTASWVANIPSPQTIQVAQGTAMIVRNTLTCDTPKTDKGQIQIHKRVVNRVGDASMQLPTSYPMTVTCTPQGPTAQTVQVPPSSAGSATVTVPAPSQCIVTEAPLTPMTGVKGCRSGKASWTTTGSPSAAVTVAPGATASVMVVNTLACDPPPVADCPNPTKSSIGCRVTVTIKRTKGAPVYSVLVSPAATVTTPNVTPSTGASCVIGSNVMVNQTTCWFNYNTNPTTVTLTATSSTGTLPSGFNWSGACSGSSPSCVLPATLTQQLVNANF